MGVSEKIAKLKYVVLTYNPDIGLAAARSTEGFIFVVAHPFEHREAAVGFLEDMKKLTGTKGLLFEKVELRGS